jgi:hypothetical protein
LTYPALEPFETGMLDVGDGNLVYWETCGNPAGKPALLVHGGPAPGPLRKVWGGPGMLPLWITLSSLAALMTAAG